MKYFLNIIYIFAFIFYVPVLIIRGKWHRHFPTRLGILSRSWKMQLAGKKNIWVHAVSVGETLTIIELVEALRENRTLHNIVFSTVTKTGYALACERLEGKADVIYAPCDFSWAVQAYLQAMRPEFYIAAETEIWPNLYHALKRRKVPIVQVNGRISDASFKRYRLLGDLIEDTLGCVQAYCMQSEEDAMRICALGAATDTVHVVGNMKFDSVARRDVPAEASVDLPDAQSYLVAGSTHAGEELLIAQIFLQLNKDFPDLRLIVAPRHIQRCEQVVHELNAAGFVSVLLSQWNKTPLEVKQVLVIDSIGKLCGLYQHARLVFIGKTFLALGGQNMIEPASFGVPTFVGPYTQNFRDVMRILLAHKAIVQVDSSEVMLEEMKKICSQPELAQAIGQRAKTCVRANQGATQRCLEIILKLLDQKT